MTTGAMVLEALYQAGGEFVRGGEIARRRKLSAVVVAGAVAELVELGYSIESHPHHGYCLRSAPDRLMADDLQARMAVLREREKSRMKFAPTGGVGIGAEILVYAKTASTNDVVAKLARTGGRDGLVVFAEEQTRGRGRQGRAWASPSGTGLWFSVLLRPKLAADAMSRLTVAASVAVAQVVREASGVAARIKWPNDVTVGNKKLAGILTELRGDTAILGIGLNVNCRREEFPAAVAATATSLLIETGAMQDRAALAARLLGELEARCWQAIADFEAVTGEWARLCTTLGQQIAVRLGARRVVGHAQALDGAGALLVRKDNGQVERITGGEVGVE